MKYISEHVINIWINQAKDIDEIENKNETELEDIEDDDLEEEENKAAPDILSDDNNEEEENEIIDIPENPEIIEIPNEEEEEDENLPFREPLPIFAVTKNTEIPTKIYSPFTSILGK